MKEGEMAFYQVEGNELCIHRAHPNRQPMIQNPTPFSLMVAAAALCIYDMIIGPAAVTYVAAGLLGIVFRLAYFFATER